MKPYYEIIRVYFSDGTSMDYEFYKFLLDKWNEANKYYIYGIR